MQSLNISSNQLTVKSPQPFFWEGKEKKDRERNGGPIKNQKGNGGRTNAPIVKIVKNTPQGDPYLRLKMEGEDEKGA